MTYKNLNLLTSDKKSTQIFIEKLKIAPVKIGCERLASAQHFTAGDILVCAKHRYLKSSTLLAYGNSFKVCYKCIEEDLNPVGAADLDDKVHPFRGG